MDEAPPDDALLVVPWTALDAEVLAALAEEFVLREGTDYGTSEASQAAKVAAVLKQLSRGEAQIVWHLESESFDILTTVALAKRGILAPS